MGDIDASFCLTCHKPKEERSLTALSAIDAKIVADGALRDGGFNHIVDSGSTAPLDCPLTTCNKTILGDDKPIENSRNEASVTIQAAVSQSLPLPTGDVDQRGATSHRKRQGGADEASDVNSESKKVRISYDGSETKYHTTSTCDGNATNKFSVDYLMNESYNDSYDDHVKFDNGGMDAKNFNLSKDERESDDDDHSEIICWGASEPKPLASKSGDLSKDERGSDDDVSEIICWDASEQEPLFAETSNVDIDENRKASDILTESIQCASMPPAKETHIDSQPVKQSINDVPRDVCYICGSDLSKLKTGMRGRVAHMKRCSAKHGNITMGGNDDVDLVAPAEDVLHSIPSSSNSKKTVFNPYSKDHWHGDANVGIEAIPSFDSKQEAVSSTKNQSKQTALDKFFKAPVRSLTNVLMAGSKRLAKSKSIDDKKKSTATKGNKPRGKWAGGGGWRSNQNRGDCPSYKKIPGTDFICDGFNYASQTLSNNYFLTHFHSDHYGGITKQWNEGTIYCSLPTANLVHQQLGVEKRYLHPIPMNTPTVIASKGKPITVTLLDANHCPGAIMFIFEVGNKNILHVGDFRWNQSFHMKIPQLRAFSNMTPRLDEIFLDTTYCNPKYTLPSQDEAISATINIVKDEISTANMMGTKSLLLCGSYTIGKEKIYLSIAEYLDTKVYVDKRRYRILSALEWPKERMNLFTTEKSESFLWVVPLGHVNFKKMPEYLDDGNKNKPAFSKPYGRVVGFRPTGWTYTSDQSSKLISSKTSGRFCVHGVPYSEHSAFPELVDCLKSLKPKKITTTVSVSKSEEQCQMLLNALKSSN